MTSTPVSMNNESLNGSWIDITNTSPPVDDCTAQFLNCQHQAPSSAATELVQQNLGLISFQVQRFLQEARGNQSATTTTTAAAATNSTTTFNNNNIPPTNAPPLSKSPPTQRQPPCDDNNSGIYASDASDLSLDKLGTKAIIETLKQQQQLHQDRNICNHPNYDNYKSSSNFYQHQHQQLDLSKSQDSFADFQLSDSLSFISRLSGLEVDYAGNCLGCSNGAELGGDQFDWLWDWSWQPEFFSGQEWKVCTPKQDYLMRQRQLYGANHHHHPHHHSHFGPDLFSSDMLSLLFLSNILSIIIGAGITYSILMRKSNV